jgi:four helix bundle protein
VECAVAKINNFRDLEVYKKLFKLHFEVHDISLTFPRFELYELGSQVRRSSNSAPANLAEGWNNRHTNIFIESINRAIGECQETQHHLNVAFGKNYITEEKFEELDNRYNECIKMLFGLKRKLQGAKYKQE